MADGFDLRELSVFTRDLALLASQKMPKHTKKFMIRQGGQLRTQVKKVAKRLVKEDTGNYIAGIKRGKVYFWLEDEMSIRVYGGSPHAHLIEYGHIPVGHKPNKVDNGGFVPGRYVFREGYKNFKEQFYNNTEKFVDEMLDNGLS